MLAESAPTPPAIAHFMPESQELELPHGLGQVPLQPEFPREFNVDLETAGSMFRSGLVVLDRNRRIISANHFAREILDTGEALRIGNRCLVIEKAYVQRSFEDVLRRVTSAVLERSFNASQVPFIGVPDRTGAVRYALKVVSATEQEQGIEILLAVVDLVDRTGPSRATFSAVFRLSEREAELAELFSCGFKLEEISHRMGVALNTARVHLRSIFAKTNCTGQLELMRMLTRLTVFLLTLAEIA